MAEFNRSDIVELDYWDLINSVDLTGEISKAFGVDGVGVLTVKNVPNYVAARQNLLPLSRKFAILPENIKEKYVHSASSYSFGWSHGKENLQGKPDVSKGSFYANPQFDRPVDDDLVIAKHAPFVHPNIWPTDDLPELELAFKTLGQLIVEVGKLVAKQCDSFVHAKCNSYPRNSLETVISTSLCCKARLLHYFPIPPSDTPLNTDSSDGFSSWCGWHNDHGSLTGLTSALYVDLNGNIVENTDPTAGASAIFINVLKLILFFFYRIVHSQ
jgi:isopenicillin N synthase-like dioxygenase